MRRGNQAATARRLEGEQRVRDERDDPETMTDNALWSAVYRLQGRNRGGTWNVRIRALSAEQVRRRERGTG